MAHLLCTHCHTNINQHGISIGCCTSSIVHLYCIGEINQCHCCLKKYDNHTIHMLKELQWNIQKRIKSSLAKRKIKQQILKTEQKRNQMQLNIMRVISYSNLKNAWFSNASKRFKQSYRDTKKKQTQRKNQISIQNK